MSHNTEPTFTFHKSDTLPDLDITTPLTFAYVGRELVLCQKRDLSWDILGGKIEKGETWMQALVREAYEEAGVHIENISLVGYILAENSKSTIYPPKSILPVTISFVKEIDYEWSPKETINRNIFRKSKVLQKMSSKKDFIFMKTVYENVEEFFTNFFPNIEFSYSEDNCFDIPTTQVMTFCENGNGEYCIVRDYDESHFSLPGGGCDLGEKDEDCAKREVLEEAQIQLSNLFRIANVIVKVFDAQNNVVSLSKHVRFHARASSIENFIPQKNGMETIERKFVSVEELRKLVPLLQNSAGDEILKIIKKIK